MKNPLDSKYAFLGALALGASLLVAGPALAQNSPNNAGVQVAAQTSADDEIICKIIRVTGTRIPTEHCLTKGEWDDIRVASREFMERILRVGSGG